MKRQNLEFHTMVVVMIVLMTMATLRMPLLLIPSRTHPARPRPLFALQTVPAFERKRRHSRIASCKGRGTGVGPLNAGGAGGVIVAARPRWVLCLDRCDRRRDCRCCARAAGARRSCGTACRRTTRRHGRRRRSPCPGVVDDLFLLGLPVPARCGVVLARAR